jgi:Tfp pilus assembly protein PilZ
MENRKCRRFTELDDVIIVDNRRPLDAAADGLTCAYTQNISVSGARIISQEEFPVGNIIGIIANLQKANQSLRVDGKVIWTRKTRNGAHFHMGVEFLHKFPDTVLLLIKQLHGLNPPT